MCVLRHNTLELKIATGFTVTALPSAPREAPPRTRRLGRRGRCSGRDCTVTVGTGWDQGCGKCPPPQGMGLLYQVAQQMSGMNQEGGPETEAEADQPPGDGARSAGLTQEDVISKPGGVAGLGGCRP